MIAERIVWVLILALAAIAVLTICRVFVLKVSGRNAKASPESRIVVNFDGETLTSTFPNGDKQSIYWKDIIRVEVHTNDTGPWGMDVWFVLIGSDAECSFPLGATGEDKVLEKLKQLPGFALDGMNCTSNKVFTCWERTA